MNWRTRATALRRASRTVVLVAILCAAGADSARAQTTISPGTMDLGAFTNDVIRRQIALRQQELDLIRQRNDLQNQLSTRFQSSGLSFQPMPLSQSPWPSQTSFLDSLQQLSNAVPGGISAINRSDLSSLFNKERELISAKRSALQAARENAPAPFAFNPVFNVESNANAVNNNANDNNNLLRNDPRMNNSATSDLDSRFDLSAGGTAPAQASAIPGTRAFAQPGVTPSSSLPSINGTNGAFDPLDPFRTSRTATPNVFSQPMNDIGNINPIDRQKMQFPGSPAVSLTPAQQAERDRFFENRQVATTPNSFPPGNASGLGGRFDQFPSGNAFGLRQGLQPQTAPGPNPGMTGTNGM